jgi:hypothetical protein
MTMSKTKVLIFNEGADAAVVRRALVERGGRVFTSDALEVVAESALGISHADQPNPFVHVFSRKHYLIKGDHSKSVLLFFHIDDLDHAAALAVNGMSAEDVLNWAREEVFHRALEDNLEEVKSPGCPLPLETLNALTGRLDT